MMNLAKSDCIEVRGIHVYAYVGVFSHEKRDGQNFYIDLRLYPGYSRASETDDLDHTVSYAEAADIVQNLVRHSSRDLIEALAGDVAQALLHTFPSLLAVEVCIHKPEAPVGHKVQDISFSLRRYRFNQVVLAFGSNMGDRLRNIENAAQDLAAHPAITHFRMSSIYETKAWGMTEQADFLNAVAIFEAQLTPYELLALCQSLEDKYGRVRTSRWGPRTLDLDIIYYGAYLSHTEELILPHPYHEERDFVKLPLRELENIVLPSGEALPDNMKIYREKNHIGRSDLES